MTNDSVRIERDFQVRFAHIDGARVIYYPRYLEIVADTFPEASMNCPPFDIAIRFMRSNRLGDTVKMVFEGNARHWSVSGGMGNPHFSIEVESATDTSLTANSIELASFNDDERQVAGWMCGPDSRLHLSRYYELISNAIEQWFENSLGMTFHELHIAQDIGIPTVQLNTRCLRLPLAGEAVSMGIRPISVGSSSLLLNSWLICNNEALLETSQAIVFVRLHRSKIQKIRIPEALKQRMSSQLAARQPE